MLLVEAIFNMEILMLILFILLIVLPSCHSGVVNPQGTILIQETEDNIITGARKMIYHDSLIGIIDVSGLELFLIGRDGSIVKKITPEDSYSDSITVQAKTSLPFNDFIRFEDLKKIEPEAFKDIKIANYYTQQIFDFVIFDHQIGYTASIATFRLLSDSSAYFNLHPIPSFILQQRGEESSEVKTNIIKPFTNTLTSGTDELFYYGKYSNTFLSHCLNELLSGSNKRIDTIDFDSVYRFIEYNNDIEPIKLVQSFPEELSSKGISLFLRDRVTQTSDSAFWSIGNYHDVVYNLKNGNEFKLNTPGNTCGKYLERLLYFEYSNFDSLKYIHNEYGIYLNYEVLSLDATPEDDLIIDLLHAVINEETGKKEQYHILQKYSRSGELLGEKVFPQDGKLGNLQRIAYSAERDEFAFLIFKDEKWLLAYSEEDKVW